MQDRAHLVLAPLQVGSRGCRPGPALRHPRKELSDVELTGDRVGRERAIGEVTVEAMLVPAAVMRANDDLTTKGRVER